MTPTPSDVREQLTTVRDPANEDDIVSMGLVNDISIEDETARISLAFNAPMAPEEIAIGNEIREAIDDLGLEADLRARVTEEHGFDTEILPGIRNVVAVASGKGGVGKTTVATNIAAGLKQLGGRVGILDADVHGPNVPRILPPDGDPGVTPDDEIVPPRSDGVMVMSTDLLMPEGDDPAVLRGPMVNNVMMKFINEVEWGRLDYLVVDLPPGTGDASLNLLQNLPVTGTVIVTTPQDMALDDAKKSLNLFKQHDSPILGVVENMSTFQCPNCDDTHEVFGTSDLAAEFDAEVLAKLPVHPDFNGEEIEGPVVRDEASAIQSELVELAETVADRVGQINRQKVAEHLGEAADEDGEAVAAASTG
jgi:ATP-binding protein involved in chromosome partitioning